jgi:hypothetical protein
MRPLSSAPGAHLTWTLPFGLLIMFAIFNRFDSRLLVAAGVLGASSGQACGTWCCRASVVGIGPVGPALFRGRNRPDQPGRRLTW